MGKKQKLYCKYDYVIERLLEDPNYDVREDGTIWVREEDSWRLAGWNKRNYRWLKYKNFELTAHRIVYRKFIGNLDPFLFINHIDGNGLNNHPSNLELVAQKENLLHRYRVLKNPPVIGYSKINFEIAQKIREEKKLGLSHKLLAEKYKVAKSTVSDIINNKIWKKVS